MLAECRMMAIVKRMNPDELVSYNLGRARSLHGWTQQKAADEVSRFLGKHWSVQVYGDAERAHRLERVKTFSASEIVAICRAFGLPASWFFEAPSAETDVACFASAETITAERLREMLFPSACAHPRIDDVPRRLRAEADRIERLVRGSVDVLNGVDERDSDPERQAEAEKVDADGDVRSGEEEADESGEE